MSFEPQRCVFMLLYKLFLTMNRYIYLNNIVFFILLLLPDMAQGQIMYRKYMRPPFQADTSFNTNIRMFASNSITNHVWLTALNAQYTDTTKNKINPSAIPAYVPINKNSLLNPYSVPNQIIGALIPYGSYSPASLYPPAYYPVNKSYPLIPYGYSPYSIKASSSPHYILPQF
ncbi:hypothetical protein CHU_3126 [Cytophaga hutchinsonii ATCC 33406]|uniref:Uncharacterized protein n=2 Tax=Cytophaga hutchinsonii TaxID=985 RepID=A0A6N4SVB7_CYTH3|nr:hypothetical protein CHU_3126 [Cytophaga hutchinsonii ATCC 33406]